MPVCCLLLGLLGAILISGFELIASTSDARSPMPPCLLAGFRPTDLLNLSLKSREFERPLQQSSHCFPPFSLIFLALICFLSFGSYFVYDSPAALQDQIKSVRRRVMSLDAPLIVSPIRTCASTPANSCCSIHSTAVSRETDKPFSSQLNVLAFCLGPNVFLCFVGGFLMDKVLGLR